MHDYGISLKEPRGWNTRFYRIIEPLRGGAMLQAATVPLVESDLSTYQPDTCATMTANDALLIAMIFDPDPEIANFPKPVRASVDDFKFVAGDFTHLQGLPDHQIQSRVVFKHAGRICELVGCFGSSNPDAALVAKIISSLRTLRVGSSAAKEPNGDAVEIRLPT